MGSCYENACFDDIEPLTKNSSHFSERNCFKIKVKQSNLSQNIDMSLISKPCNIY